MQNPHRIQVVRIGVSIGLAAVLGACNGSSSGSVTPPASAPLITNSGLATHRFIGQDELWVVNVREPEQGGVDLNGDGDASDDVLHVLDLATGELTNTGLANETLPFTHIPLPPLEGGGERAYFGVYEAAQAGLDLNGDGDANDLVLHVFERATRTSRNLGLAALRVLVGEELVAGLVSETAQGASDLDGDGHADGLAAFVYDLRDDSVTFLPSGSIAVALHGDFVAFVVSESDGVDHNADGDTDDGAVLEFYDARPHTLGGPGLAAGVPTQLGDVWGFFVSEANQGHTDLNGDGDADDSVFHTFDPRTAELRNIGLAGDFYYDGGLAIARVDPERFVLATSEAEASQDFNGDGDQLDTVVQLHDPVLQQTIDTGLASFFPPLVIDGWLYTMVAESMQGGVDLDGRNGVNGHVAHAFELATRKVVNLRLDAFIVPAAEGVLLLPFEGTSAVDWNGDGDLDDFVLQSWNPSTRRLVNSHVAVTFAQGMGAHAALISIDEAASGSDLNGDGDRQDSVLEQYDFGTRQLVDVGLAISGAPPPVAPGWAIAEVSESGQGVDLNGDGNLDDLVLHLVRAQ